MPPTDSFPPSDFDPWAETYDQDVQSLGVFPFDGYDEALETVVRLAGARPGLAVLDLGTGTANLAVRFARHGCELWCTDFSEAMLAKAREKLPHANFVRADLRAEWPAALNRRFDAIVSAYVFHHFDLDAKVSLCRQLVRDRLTPDGKLMIADLSFPNALAMRQFAQSVGELWEQEPYWLADEAIRALENAGIPVAYRQVSACAGIYLMRG